MMGSHIPKALTIYSLVLLAGLVVTAGCNQSGTNSTTGAVMDYSLALTPSPLTIAPSDSSDIVVTITRTNFTGPVTLSLSGAPAGVTGVFNPGAPTGNSSTLTMSIGPGVTLGPYNLLMVDGTATAGNHSTPLTLTVSTTSGRVYTTGFPLLENPIFESGIWLNGGQDGANWTDINTTPGLAFGTQTGNAPGPAQFADSTAVLTGTWGANQQAQAVVFNSNPKNGSGIFEEVEIRLNTTITSGSITGYECNYSLRTDGSQYAQIVRWNGPLADFTLLNSLRLTVPVTTGTKVMCQNVGGAITTYVNGTAIFSVTDSTYTGGSPGIGMFLQGTTGVNRDYGFMSFSASDGP
jgi:hypothetical protein